ncbi:hypothetical protein C8Q74DRAFT_1318661 [Fomes fomentarius]|nr:hypothetical protein C8Q74DRAFT_1318661 [Fomes fomentarius]
MFECTTCKKVLKKESALVQHCKDKGHPYVAPVAKATPVRAPASTASLPTTSAAASSTAAVASSSTAKILIECALCSTSFDNKTSYDQHVASKHPPKPFKCAPCGVDFSSAEALSIHYKHFAVHPKCPQCGSAFIDQTQLKLHQAIHPKCSQCGSIFLNRAHLEEFASVADRNRHYSVSPSHPNCFVCREGFADDSELEKHLVRAHLDAKCRLCNRQFRSVDELQGHYLTSAMHPHCALCEIGFPDDESCDRVCPTIRIPYDDQSSTTSTEDPITGD